MAIYNELIRRVEDGESFYVNFKNKSLKIGKKFVIKDGIYDGELFPDISFDLDTSLILSYTELLYEQYKYSMPSERSDSKRRQYFKALSADNLTDEQMATGEFREVARAKLEGFILCTIVNGTFKWDEETMGKWFWQSKKDSDLVILKSWIENNNN